MSAPYQKCDPITYFAYSDAYGNQISQVTPGQSFNIAVGVRATSGAARVSDAGAQFNADTSIAIPLDDASFLWDPDYQQTLACVVSSNQYRIEYDHIAGNWLYGVSAYAYDGSTIQAGDWIFGGQMLEFRDPASLAPLTGTVELGPVVDRSAAVPMELSVTSASVSNGIAYFNNAVLTGNVACPDDIQINASYYPPGANPADPASGKTSQQGPTIGASVDPNSFYLIVAQTYSNSTCSGNAAEGYLKCVLGSVYIAEGAGACVYVNKYESTKYKYVSGPWPYKNCSNSPPP
jgi:hypothetical protein